MFLINEDPLYYTVKIVITKEVHKIIDSFVNDETSNDAKIFATRTGIKMIKRKGK